MKLSTLAPLLIFFVLVIALGVLLLRPASTEMISRPAPPIDIALTDKTALINFYASWCTPCRAEHPQLMALATEFPVYGVAYKDTQENIVLYLQDLGDPFTLSLIDNAGKIFIDWGLSGVPESFVVKDGVIRYHHRGDIKQSDLNNTILPLMRRLEKE